jgi:5-methylcytosine-specific restriction endonuclease McrA
MPVRAPRICGCGKLVASGVLCACQVKREAERKARAEQVRPTARERGYDTKWQREREAFLKQRPICERVSNGKPCGQPATVVHHLVPHRGDRSLFWRRSNWSPRCRPCHDVAEQAAERRSS